jgi:hypothetical protein
MNWKNATVIFIVSIILLIAGWDVIAIVNGGKQASISATVIRWSHDYPSFTFIMGFTFGHLFWRMKDKDVGDE